MRILVTRPRAEAGELCARLEALGHTARIEPLLSIELLDPTIDEPRRFQATIVTSRNALRSLARSPGLMTSLATSPLYPVGAATAAHARSLGFKDVRAGAGTAAELVEIVAGNARPKDGSILYLSGEVTAADIPAALEPRGLPVHVAMAYRAKTATAFSAETLAAFQASEIDAVTLLSARTALTYAGLIDRHHLRQRITNIHHLCLSGAVAQAMAPLRTQHVHVASRPNVEELLALAGDAAKCLR